MIGRLFIISLLSLCLFPLGIEAQGVFDGASWIGATADVNDSLADRSIIVEKQLQCNDVVDEATMTITGLGAYELYLNGRKANDDIMSPAWSDYNKSVFYNTVDVTSLLRKGINTLSVILGNTFYHERGLRYHKTKTSYGPLTMICSLRLKYKSGTVQTIVSDKSWCWRLSPVTYNSIYGGEDYDARMPFFDVKAKSCILATTPVVVQRAPAGILRPQMSQPVKIMERFSPVGCHAIADADLPAVSKACKHDVPKGTFILDMGQNLSGFPEIKVKGKAGQKVVMYVSETHTKEGACNQRQTGRPYYFVYTLKGDGVETWHPRFTYYGYRYIQVEGAVLDGKLAKSIGGPVPGKGAGTNSPVILGISSCFIYNSAQKTGTFECSNQRINDTYRIIDRAIRSNWQSVWTDCPHREKLGWLEQDWLNGEGLVYNYDCQNMIEQTMRVIADAQHPDGSLPEIAPEYITFEGSWAPPFQQSPEWGGAVVALPFLYNRHYGSDKLIREYYPVMLRYVDYLATQDSCLILKQGLGDWYDYGPWRAGFAKNTSMPFVSTAHYYQWTKMVADAARIVGNAYDAVRLQQHAADIKAALNKEFYHQDTHQYDTGSQCANAIALDMHLMPETDRQAVMDNLVADIHAHGDRLTTGDVGNRYLFKVLDDNGLQELLYTMLNHDDVPGYGFQIQKGMTTLTEQWNPEMGASMNHFMLAHINNHLIPSLAGIRVSGSDVVIAPKPVGDIQWVKASTATAYGIINVDWRRAADGTIKTNYSVPQGMTVKYIEPK